MAEKEFKKPPCLFLAALGEPARNEAFRIMCALQRLGVTVEMDYEGKSLKSQMRRSDKFNSQFTLIIGEEELEKGRGVLKNMLAGIQEEIPLIVAEIFGKVYGQSV